jgi:hypothetical protein
MTFACPKGEKNMQHMNFYHWRIKKIFVYFSLLFYLVFFFLCCTNEINQTPPIKHLIVYQEQGKFCGWPANHGIWNWGDEILVGFELGYYKESPTKHSFDREKPKIIVMARSIDGGETWKLEKPEGLISSVLGGKKEISCPGGINFKDPNFAMKCSSDRFYISYDRGETWEGAYNIPYFDQKDVMARTDYLVNDKNECLYFLTATKADGKEGRPFCAATRNGGKSIEFLSWIAPEPTGYTIMPASVRCSPEQIISAVRNYERGEINKGWIDIYVSNSNGHSWEFLSKVADTGSNGGNPPSMIKLKDGRICVTYGYRSAPYSIRAKLSTDNGKTWGREIHLRDDGRSWDIGYTRTVQRNDGKLVTVYYFTTATNPEQHIAATIWDVDLAN